MLRISKIFQDRLTISKVLLINLTTSITELAKNLVLSGINVTVYDKMLDEPAIVNKNDVKNNFFLSKREIGQIRSKVICKKLSLINTFTKIEELENFKEFNSYSVVIMSYLDKDQLEYFEEITGQYNIPFYCIIPTGSYSYFISNINKGFMNEKILFKLKVDKLAKSHLSKFNEKVRKNEALLGFLLLNIFGDENYEKLINNESLKKQIDESFLKENHSVCSIISGIISQEIIKIITSTDNISDGIYMYDSEKQFGKYYIN